MGSTGHGRLSDYSEKSGKQLSNKKPGEGGSDGKDQCDNEINTALEEVERSAYFLTYDSLPGINTPVKLVLKKRPCVVTTDSEEVLGYLPTKFNYVAACLRAGHKFEGIIELSTERPLPKIIVFLSPA
jgi:hypothetical protein